MDFSADCLERFWEKVDTTGECWTWTAAKTPLGYGQFHSGDRNVRAHRYSYTLTHGEPPAGLKVLHACDNPACVRPEHLFLGTQRTNVLDMRQKGRGAKQGRACCPNGHPLTDGNLVPSALKRGERTCLACAREAGRENWRKKYGKAAGKLMGLNGPSDRS